MKKCVQFACAATAIAAISAPAFAQTYVGVSVGATLPENSKNKGEFTQTVPATADFPAIPAGTALGWTTEFDTGYDISAQIGHRFDGGLRVEGEFNYSRAGIDTHRALTVGGANIDSADVAVLTRGTPNAANPRVGAVLDSGIGKQENYGVFANVLYDFNSGGSFQPYVGGGIGAQRTKFDYRPSDVDVGQGSDTNFAWQLIAGATYKISPSFEVFGQYRYRNAGKTTYGLDLLPADLTSQAKQSIFALGLRLPFGQ